MEQSIYNIYDKKLIDSLSDLSYEFWEYANDEYQIYNINNKVIKEIELVFLHPLLSFFTNVANYKDSISTSYIEVKNIIDKNKKVRYRLEHINEFAYYMKNDINIVKEIMMRMKPELKITQKIIKSKSGDFIFKTADEMRNNDLNKKEGKISLYLVNSILYKNSYFKLELRHKTLLKRGNNNVILSYFNHDNTARSIEVEIELIKKDGIKKEDFIKKFKKIMRILFSFPDKDFFICTNENKFEIPYIFLDVPLYNIRTNMINLAELINLDSYQYLITKKIDGETTKFCINNGKCYFIKFGIILEFLCNIPPEYRIIGIGEYTDITNIRSLYPFYYYKIEKYDNKKYIEIKFKTRLEYFNFIKHIIETSPFETSYIEKNSPNNTPRGIKIEAKEIFGLFENKIDFLKNCIECFNKITPYPTDGIILCKNSLEKENTIDFKFKKNNTIDLLTNYSIINKEKNDMLNFNLYMTIYRNNKKEYKKIYEKQLALSELFTYDGNLSMIIYDNNNKKEILPVNFISEYFIDEGIFVPRLDKTEKLIKYKYTGNSENVVLQSKIIHKYNLYNDIKNLSDLVYNNNLEEINNLAIKIENLIKEKLLEEGKLFDQIVDNISNKEITKIEKKNYIIEPLNLNKRWYKDETNNSFRSGLNIISNMNKTQGVAIAIGPFLHSKAVYKSLCSIYCGKGGDMGKYIINGIENVLGIDPDAESLKIFEERREAYEKNKNKIFQLITIPIALEERNFLEKLNAKTNSNKTYDVIDIQLGLHFSYTKELEDHIGNILEKLANKHSNPSTKLLISTNDKDNILKLFEERGNPNIIDLQLDKTNQYIISKINDKKISIYYSASMNEHMEEYLVSSKELIAFLEKRNFKLIQTWTFNELVDNPEIYNKLDSIYTRASTKKFLGLIKNIEIKEFDLLKALSILRYYILEYDFK